MHATKRLLLSTGGALKAEKLLLPPPTPWESLFHTLQGLWMVATDPQKRQAFEDAIQNQIIKDDVLKNAPYGAGMTFQLFANLQSPLWKTRTTTFDAKQFTTALVPALTNLHDYLHTFQNEIRQEYMKFNDSPPSTLGTSPDASSEQEKEKDDEKERDETPAENASWFQDKAVVLSDLNIKSKGEMEDGNNPRSFQFLETPYPWRDQAAADPDSVAGCLSRMTTPDFLDNFALSSKLGLFVTKQHSVYEEGSAKVNQVAMLSARAMELPLPGQSVQRDDNDPHFEEFRASEEAKFKFGVAAQIDVLYEITNRFHEDVFVGSTKEDGTPERNKTEYVEYRRLIVAGFEGWLDKGAESINDVGLRWRVPYLREPYEFPMITSASRTVLSTEDAKKETEPTEEEEAATDQSSNTSAEKDAEDRADNEDTDSNTSKDTAK